MAKISRKQSKKRALIEEGKDYKTERFPFREEDLRYYKVKMQPKKQVMQ